MTNLTQTMANKAAGANPATTTQIVRTPEQERKQKLLSLVRGMEKHIATVLPQHITPERLTNVLLFAINQNPELAACEPNSFISAVVSMSQLGMEVGPLGHAYLVPFNKSVRNGDNWTKIKLCQFILGYRGMLEMVRRSNNVKSINADVIREGDYYEYESGVDVKLIHRPALAGRGEVIAYYVAVKMKDDTATIGLWSQEDVDRHIKMIKAMPGKSSEKDGMWATFRTEFAHKSIIRTMFKWLSTSIEDQRLMASDGQVLSLTETASGEPTIEIDMTPYKDEIIDAVVSPAEITTEPAVEAEQPTEVPKPPQAPARQTVTAPAQETGEVKQSPVDELKGLMLIAFDTKEAADKWARETYQVTYNQLAASINYKGVKAAIEQKIAERNADKVEPVEQPVLSDVNDPFAETE
jgi:recombination protein RecT